MSEITRITQEMFPVLMEEQQSDLGPCPAPIAKIILQILRTGLIQTRLAGWAGNADRCASHADHLHNLPDLLSRYSPRKLQYYWNAERPAFINRMGGQPLVFEEIWAELEPLMPPPPEATVSQGV